MYRLEYNDNAATRFYEQYEDKIRDVIKKEIKGLKTTHPDFLCVKLILDNLDSNVFFLKRLITARPKTLDVFIKYFEQKVSEMSDEKFLKRRLHNIFVKNIYDGEITIPGKRGGRTKQEDFFDKAEFVERKKLSVCPYCGRNYIYMVRKPKTKEEDGESVIKPDLDHFLPKSKYPYFAFSYYNLIPSCIICNRSPCKQTKDPRGQVRNTSCGDVTCKIANPYELEIDSFRYQFNILNLLKNFDSENVEIKFDFPPEFNVESYQYFFGLEELYKRHNDLAYELILRKRFWSTLSSKKNYKDILQETEISSDFIQAYFGFYSTPSEYGRRPLSKFLHDIS